MTILVCEQCGKAGLLSCDHVIPDRLYDLSERLRRRAELLEADCRIYDADDIVEVADRLQSLSTPPQPEGGTVVYDLLAALILVRDNNRKGVKGAEARRGWEMANTAIKNALQPEKTKP